MSGTPPKGKAGDNDGREGTQALREDSPTGKGEGTGNGKGPRPGETLTREREKESAERTAMLQKESSGQRPGSSEAGDDSRRSDRMPRNQIVDDTTDELRASGDMSGTPPKGKAGDNDGREGTQVLREDGKGKGTGNGKGPRPGE